MPRTSMENNRRPGRCSCNLYNVGYDAVIDGDDKGNDGGGDGGGDVKVEGRLLFFLDF